MNLHITRFAAGLLGVIGLAHGADQRAEQTADQAAPAPPAMTSIELPDLLFPLPPKELPPPPAEKAAPNVKPATKPAATEPAKPVEVELLEIPDST